MLNKPTQPREIAIKVSNVSKDFILPHESSNSLKSKLINFKSRGYEIQHALKDVSFEVNKGDFFGIVGRNGSGKSTLLKILSEIYTPTRGSVRIDGKLTPFIELGVGFNPELSGRDNVYLNGALLGFGRKEVDEMYDDIVEFAELERFMDQKLKNYSSGMQVRLAFSIAIRADTDILVLDEVLAVGDEAFQRKCNDYFEELKQKGKTVILVTHGMDNVRKFCNKALMIRDGNVVAIGTPEDIANEYSLDNLEQSSRGHDGQIMQTIKIKNLRVEVLSNKQMTQDDDLQVRVSYTSESNEPTRIRLALRDVVRDVPLVASNTALIKDKKVSKTLRLKLDTINDSQLKIQVTVRNKNNDIVGFLSENETPSILMHRTDYPDPTKPIKYAVLHDRGNWN